MASLYQQIQRGVGTGDMPEGMQEISEALADEEESEESTETTTTGAEVTETEQDIFGNVDSDTDSDGSGTFEPGGDESQEVSTSSTQTKKSPSGSDSDDDSGSSSSGVDAKVPSEFSGRVPQTALRAVDAQPLERHMGARPKGYIDVPGGSREEMVELAIKNVSGQPIAAGSRFKLQWSKNGKSRSRTVGDMPPLDPGATYGVRIFPEVSSGWDSVEISAMGNSWTIDVREGGPGPDAESPTKVGAGPGGTVKLSEDAVGASGGSTESGSDGSSGDSGTTTTQSPDTGKDPTTTSDEATSPATEPEVPDASPGSPSADRPTTQSSVIGDNLIWVALIAVAVLVAYRRKA